MLAATHIIPTPCPPICSNANGGASGAAREACPRSTRSPTPYGRAGSVRSSPAQALATRRVARLRLFPTPASDSRALLLRLIGVAPAHLLRATLPSYNTFLARPSGRPSRGYARLHAGSLQFARPPPLQLEAIGSACDVRPLNAQCLRALLSELLLAVRADALLTASAPAASHQSVCDGEQPSASASESHAANGDAPYAPSVPTPPHPTVPGRRGRAAKARSSPSLSARRVKDSGDYARRDGCAARRVVESMRHLFYTSASESGSRALRA
ncbi:hypothetical protein FB451DRAFT_1385474 [Mycena latifolia]|nr:hypothetical protein FB451DRAFT_1385474 [Mycena latifolia]